MSKKTKKQPPEPPVTCDSIYELRYELLNDIVSLGEAIALLGDITRDFDGDAPGVPAHLADCAGQVFIKLRDRMDEHMARCYQFRAWLKNAEQKKGVKP